MNRGSEWRRWELHLHTPGTKKEDRYTGNTIEDKWDNFYSTVSAYVGDETDPTKSISAIAITDYLSIDNYFKVRKDERLPKCIKFVFPNVELRMRPVAKDSPINIHCLFSPDIAEDLESRFFCKINIEYKHKGYSAAKSELIRFGRAFANNAHLPEQGALAIGLEQYIISFESLSSVFKDDSELREKTIIVVSNKSNDGVSGLQAHSDYFERNISQLEATRRSIYQLSDMIFSSNPKDIAYFLGEGADNPDTVKEKCGSLMPCVHGCDAHSNDKVFAPDGDRFCWIKADLTFEGLKQILYEPKERVRISSTIPDSKPSYYVIDHVRIDGNNDFSSEPIYFSDKLTCIVGGKSTGKSLLLHNMAMAIDEEQVQKKQQTAATNVKRIPELKVFWNDGTCSSEKDKQRKIVYIPQTYLNRLSDEEQETTEIDTIIQDIVLQDEQCFGFYRLLQQSVSAQKQDLAKGIVDFIKIFSDKKDVTARRNEIGDQDSISSEISKLCAQLDQLSKQFNITEADVNAYQSSVEKSKILKDRANLISKECRIISQIPSVVEVKTYNNYGLSILSDSYFKAVSEVEKVATSVWMTQRDQMVGDANQELNEIQIEIGEQSKIIERLQPKMDGSEQISKLSAEIVEEKARLAKLEEVESQLKVLQDAYTTQLESLSKSFEKFSHAYSLYVNSVTENFTPIVGDLEFSVKKVFRIEQFSQKIAEVLNNKSTNRFKKFDLRDIHEDDLSSDNMVSFIESLITNTNESLQIKGVYNTESALREILTDWYNIDYIVKMDGDSIQEMSPGKKALVLLRLLISLADSKCPILIDQPEDDLDNRSIFDELIHFIKEKKIDRQIITVTHNANIVLGGDAELVIIANQNGKNAPNRQYRFEYRGGAIEDNSPIFDGVHPAEGILNSKGIQEHICEILEGGEQAFALRQHKYHFIKH